MFNLERTEKAIFIFLVAALLAGLSVAAYTRSHAAIPVAVRTFTVGKDDAARRIEGKRLSDTTAININAANEEELARLTGIGKALASRIIAYRTSKGLFLSREDIKKVRGIGPALYEKIKDDISVE